MKALKSKLAKDILRTPGNAQKILQALEGKSFNFKGQTYTAYRVSRYGYKL